ncbi:MAG: Ldh family oxidoreductase [Pseudomonadota bacterium]
MPEATEQNDIFIQADRLRAFVTAVFVRLEVSPEDAWVVADNLVAADLRGVQSHGVARLERYVKGVRDGLIMPRASCSVVAETAATATLDAHDGLGQPAGKVAMEMAIDKASRAGAGFVAVRNSNHYGIAGYYSMMALPHDMIGISLTNTAPLVVPTFGREVITGTNPIAVAAPAQGQRPFVLDMATSAIPRGKVEVYNRKEKVMPDGWASDETGTSTGDAGRVLDNLINRRGGGLLPLGGEGEIHGGHKGYGLSLLVDVLTGVLAGGGFGAHIYEKGANGKPKPANVCHLLGALDLKGFGDPQAFRALLAQYQDELRASAKAAGQERIYIHGEREFEMIDRYEKSGVPVHPKSVGTMRFIAGDLGIPYTLD